MFKKQFQENRLFNSNLPTFFLLCLIGSIYLGTIVNYWYFLFLILAILLAIKIKPNKQQILFMFLIIVCFISLMILIPKFSLFNKLSKLLQASYVRSKIFQYFDKIYSEETSSFIKLILFGVKTEKSYIFYKQTVDLGIVWLTCIGGFHISFLSRIFKLIFKKVWKIGRWIDFSFILIYSYFLKFSYSCMRVLFTIGFETFFKRHGINKYTKIGFIGLLICFLNPSCFQSYSFVLSFVGVTSANFVISLGFENKLINSLLISVFGFASTIPFAIAMNHKISLLTFINSFIFSYVFSFIFIYFLIFSWMPFMAIMHRYVIIAIYFIVGNISPANIYIISSEWELYVVFAYYCGLYGFSKILYLIVFNNKI